MDYITKHHILKYLNKFYYTNEGLIFNKNGDFHEWGVEVAEWVSQVFTCDINKCCLIVIEWAENREDIKPSDIHGLWDARKLKFAWSMEIAQDLSRYGISNVQQQMNDLVIDGLSKEIDTKILKQLKEHIKTDDELKSLIKCIGFTVTPTVMNPITFRLEQKFISVKYHEMINERQSNNIWQNYFRPTRTDEQTQVTS